jgi:hypothetical protein
MARISGFIVVVMLAVGLGSAIADAQQRLVIVGMVQWTSANRIQIITDGGQSLSVDVSQLDQGAYSGLRGGERVRVVGFVAAERNRLIAESLDIGDASPGYWTFPQTS